MKTTMMDMPMSVQLILRHGQELHPASIVATFDGEQTHPASFAEVASGAARLAHALEFVGIGRGDRVATFCWNHRVHMEAYLAIPCMGAIMHTVNIRLFPEQIAYVINHAGDKVLLVDGSLLPLLEKVMPLLRTVEHVVVIGTGDATILGREALDYEELTTGRAEEYTWPELDERAAAAVCYTTGTTGNPKGVVYSHRSTFLHSLASRAVDTFAVNERDRILLLPPMFHANAWGLPYTAWMSGADLVLPGPHLQAERIGPLIARERITFSAAVPTLVNDLLQLHERNPLDLSSLRVLLSGGSAVPSSMIERAREVWGVPIIQGWGMTETSPLCSVSSPPRDASPDEESAWRAKSGRTVPGVEVRLVDDGGGLAPHDGATVGELQLRGPWVTGSYHEDPAPDSFSSDGWLRTGDVGTIDAKGFVQLTDRTKDVIKSGGEWISSVELEGKLVAHPDVLEAAVIGIADERWQERPLALVCRRPGSDLNGESLRQFLRDQVARFWLPECWAFLEELPKTSVGKVDKKALRALEQGGTLRIDRTART